MNSLRDKGAVVTDGTYVILGATGNTGSIVANTLLSRRKKVRVVGRDAGRLQRFARQGTEAFMGDVSDAVALNKAFRGARAAYLMLPRLPPGKTKSERAMRSRGPSRSLACATRCT